MRLFKNIRTVVSPIRPQRYLKTPNRRIMLRDAKQKNLEYQGFGTFMFGGGKRNRTAGL